MFVNINDKKVKCVDLDCASYVCAQCESENVDISINEKYIVKSVRPLHLNIDAVNKFSVNVGSKVIIEFENRLPLFVFTYEKKSINPNDYTYYFENGEFEFDEIRLKSNEKLYIGSNAVLHAHIVAQNAENIEICGSGVLDLVGISVKKRRMAKFINCKDVLIKDITMVGAIDWTLVPINCENVAIDRINIITWEVNGDGIDIVASKNVNVSNCFLHCADDCIAIKATDYDSEYGCNNCENINVKSSIFWNTKPGNAMEIGFETRCESIKNVSFVDCDVLHCMFEGWQSGGVFTIHNGDRAVVSDILYKDIRIENAEQKLFDFKVYLSHYSKDKDRGFVKNITAENIRYYGEILPPSILRGCDNEHGIKNVKIKGLYHNDKKISNMLQAHFITESGSELIFE